MKDVDYKNIKRTINSVGQDLPRFDIGKQQRTFSGYQAGDSLDTSQFSSTPAQSFAPQAAEIRKQIAPSLISSGTSLLTSGVMNALNVPSIASGLGMKVAEEGAKQGAKAAGGALGALGALGPIMNGLGLVQGGIGMASAISSFSDPVVSSSAALNSMGKSTQTKYGEAYTTYTGLDRQSIEDVVDAANSAGKANLAMSSASTGGSIGGLVGLAGGPIGSLIGWGIGSLFGGLAGLFGGESAAEKRRKRIERMMDNVATVTSDYNTNEEAEAASRGMRRIFDGQHYMADKGKDVHTNFGKPGKIKMVHTPNGIEPGIELGIGGGDETIFNPLTGDASILKEGKKRIDNISVGVPLDTENAKQEWDNTVILGNMVNPETGNTIADDARPYAEILEKSKKQNPMTRIGKRTKELNERNAVAMLNHYSDMQQLSRLNELYKHDKGKLPKCDLGWAGYALNALPHLAQLGTLFASKKAYNPPVHHTYVADDADKYVNALSQLYYDSAQDEKNIQKAMLQNMYGINNTGGLSAGQKAAILGDLNLKTTSQRNNARNEAKQKNIQLKKDAAQLGANIATTRAQRKQAAMQKYAEDAARAYEGSYANSISWNKALFDQLGALGSDIIKQYQYDKAIGIKNNELAINNQRMNNAQMQLINSMFGIPSYIPNKGTWYDIPSKNSNNWSPTTYDNWMA